MSNNLTTRSAFWKKKKQLEISFLSTYVFTCSDINIDQDIVAQNMTIETNMDFY